MKKQYESVKAVYPIVITKSDNNYLVYIPDWESNTEGSTLYEAIEMARDAISLEGITRQDLGLDIPDPSTNIKSKDNGFVTYVDIDLDKYRKLTDERTIKKTLTIPSYLNELAKENDINFSAVLTEALKERLD